MAWIGSTYAITHKNEWYLYIYCFWPLKTHRWPYFLSSDRSSACLMACCCPTEVLLGANDETLWLAILIGSYDSISYTSR
jgi:hypothetical protein